jgi:hypothetical protein
VSLPNWFDAVAFFGKGEYPPGTTHFAKLFPEAMKLTTKAVRHANPASALEVGPGTLPVVRYVPKHAYLDIVHGFLTKLNGQRVRGDLRALPFRAGSFDLVVVNDVFCHIRAPERAGCVRELCRVGRSALVGIMEGGIEGTPGAECSANEILTAMTRIGWSGSLTTIAGGLVKGRTLTWTTIKAKAPTRSNLSASPCSETGYPMKRTGSLILG